ncbi:MAG: hypothetical protein M1829_000325 [Trizodia sp. TS-e1964]|nr:MAG: hypothetical protein M1829_000325 [Trizodia sp. TS-e1964]
MAKEKAAINPAQAQRKLEKQKALKKGKAETLARRTQKLAHRNPEQLQRQIDTLRASSSTLPAHDRKRLEALERDLRIVQKARDRAPTTRRADPSEPPPPQLGKRERAHTRRSFTPPDVRAIPMPRDTPPPVPAHHLGAGGGQGANAVPLGANARVVHALPAKPEPAVPAVRAKTVYEAAPVLRDLRKEAVSRFVPGAVARKMHAARGAGRLLEGEEVEALEREGYFGKVGVQSVVDEEEGR